MAEAKPNKRKRAQRSYKPAEVANAIAEYVVCGSIRETARTTGIPFPTVKSWIHKCPELVQTCSEKKTDMAEDQIEAKLAAWSELENVALKRSVTAMSEAQAKDAATIAAISRDKQLVTVGKPTQINQNHNTNVSMGRIEDENTLKDYARSVIDGSSHKPGSNGNGNGNGSNGNRNGNGRKSAPVISRLDLP